MLKITKNFDIFLLHLTHMKSTNHNIEEMVDIHNYYPLLTEGNKCDLQLHKQSLLKHQVIDTIIDSGTLHYLNEWKGIDHTTDVPPPIVAEPTQDANVTDDHAKLSVRKIIGIVIVNETSQIEE